MNAEVVFVLQASNRGESSRHLSMAAEDVSEFGHVEFLMTPLYAAVLS